MKSFRFIALCLCSFFAVTASFAAEQKDPLRSDPRYVHAVYFLQSMNMDVDEKNIQQKQIGKQTASHFDIVKGTEVTGSISLHKGILRISINMQDEVSAYTVSQDLSGVVSVNKEDSQKITLANDTASKAWALGACQYVSRLYTNWWACASDDNPFGYIYDTSTRIGSPITSTQYTWRQDYRGRVYVCPVNEIQGYNPHIQSQCGMLQP